MGVSHASSSANARWANIIVYIMLCCVPCYYYGLPCYYYAVFHNNNMVNNMCKACQARDSDGGCGRIAFQNHINM